MSRSNLVRPRGMSLVELMVALVISSVVLTALFGVVQSQQRAYYQGHLQRAAQGSARAALTYLEQRVMLAGYGLEAPLAFDFSRYGIAADQPFPCPAQANGCPRDAVNGNDELVFFSRNPRYWLPEIRSANVAFQQPRGNAWAVAGIAGDTLTVNARPGDLFLRGRVIQLVCEGGGRWAYVTVAERQQVPDDGGSDRAVAISLRPTLEADPFRRQDVAVADACFTAGAAHAFLVDRFRFHVRPVVARAGGAGETGSEVVPYLVLDTGLDVNDDDRLDEDDETVVAEGIESFQVGYVLTDPTLLPRGVRKGMAVTFAPLSVLPDKAPRTEEGITTVQFPDASLTSGEYPYSKWSFYPYALGPTPATAAERLTDHQANIRAVRIALVARGPDPDPAEQRTSFILPVLNQDALPAWISSTVPYKRARVDTTVAARNMATRALNE